MSFFGLSLILVIVDVFVHGFPYSLRNFFLMFVFLLTSAYGGISNCSFVVSLPSHLSFKTMSTSSKPPAKLSRRTIHQPIGVVIADAGARDERQRQRAAVLAAVKGTAQLAFQCNLHDEAMDLPTAAPPVEGGSP